MFIKIIYKTTGLGRKYHRHRELILANKPHSGFYPSNFENSNLGIKLELT